MNDQETEDFDSSDVTFETVEASHNELSRLKNTDNQCVCVCHTSDKIEMDMDDEDHCRKCLKNILQNLENAIVDAYIEQISIDLQQTDW